jgi:hypothetical protein
VVRVLLVMEAVALLVVRVEQVVVVMVPVG